MGGREGGREGCVRSLQSRRLGGPRSRRPSITNRLSWPTEEKERGGREGRKSVSDSLASASHFLSLCIHQNNLTCFHKSYPRRRQGKRQN